MFIRAIYNRSGAGLRVSRRTVGNIHVPVQHPTIILAAEEVIQLPEYGPGNSARDFVQVAGQEDDGSWRVACLLWKFIGGSVCFLSDSDRHFIDVMDGKVALGETGARPVPGDSDGAENVALYVTDPQGGLKLEVIAAKVKET